MRPLRSVTHSPRLTNKNGVETRTAPPSTASGGLLQRRLGLPDASVLVLQGMIFVMVLASDTLYGRLSFLKGNFLRWPNPEMAKS